MTASTSKYQNRLAQEKSPYLLQHATNPVDWFPWGDEAFEKARREDKPVFLSIGYSTCHWCHVMEHESFANPEIAQYINAYFVPIKVDREERPDIDGVYMSAVMAMAGQGGWPLTAFLTPDKKPFFGGTYFPPYARWGSPGLVEIMQSIDKAWKTNRQQLLQAGNSIQDFLQNKERALAAKSVTVNTLDAAFESYSNSFDRRNGGFGQAPKFPSPHNLSFLLRCWVRSKQKSALEMVEVTLTKMALGGIHDHLGGGFHRYSTDAFWQVPHFEKMLYDQATLARVYLEAFQATGNAFYADVARDIFDYVLRDLTGKGGGFFSAEDADSLDSDDAVGHKREGAFYVWKNREIDTLLGKEDAAVFNFYYGIKENGNAVEDPHGEFTGKNIIFVENTIEATVKQFGLSDDKVLRILRQSRSKLFAARLNRPRPHLDDKILTDWNGLMIASLAFGARVLGDPRYLEAAEKAEAFIHKHLNNREESLWHRYRDGEAAINGTLDDYAFYIHALLELYETTFNVAYLSKAVRLSNKMVELFWDETNGGFYFTANNAERLLFRQKESYDGAIPSGNSVAFGNLIRLYGLTLDKRWADMLPKMNQAFGGAINQHSQAYSEMLSGYSFLLGPAQEIIISSLKKDDPFVKELLSEINRRFLPNKIVMLRADDDNQLGELIQMNSTLAEQKPIDVKPTVYICQNHVCEKPFQKKEDIIEKLNSLTNN